MKGTIFLYIMRMLHEWQLCGPWWTHSAAERFGFLILSRLPPPNLIIEIMYENVFRFTGKYRIIHQKKSGIMMWYSSAMTMNGCRSKIGWKSIKSGTKSVFMILLLEWCVLENTAPTQHLSPCKHRKQKPNTAPHFFFSFPVCTHTLFGSGTRCLP